MNRDEFKILAKGLKAVYTQPTFLPDADAFNVWFELLKDLDYMTAQAAIQKYMISNKFPPTIADIREYAASVVLGDKPLWSDGWEEVLMAIRKYGVYQESKALDSMSDLTKKAVIRLGFRNLCMSENITADRANFRMIFEQIADREHNDKKIPVNLSMLIHSIQKKELENSNLIESKMKGK